MSDTNLVDKLKEVGAHIAYSKSKRHPSAEKYLVARKGDRDLFDLEKTAQALEKAKEVLREYLDKKSTVLFVGTKNEARQAVKEAAEKVSSPYVNVRFIGGTITNFPEIKKRLARLKDLKAKFAAGALQGYTKKEKLMLERELKKLEEKFGGIENMERVPSLVVIVDPAHENIAFKEAKDRNIPVIAIASSDNDFSKIDYPIPANDSSVKSIEFILNYLVS